MKSTIQEYLNLCYKLSRVSFALHQCVIGDFLVGGKTLAPMMGKNQPQILEQINV